MWALRRASNPLRNLSSQSGATTSDSKVDDGFFDLDSPLETDKIGTFVDKEEDESKLDSVEVAHCSIGSSDSKSQANGEKKPKRTSLASLPFKVVMEAPRHSVNDALNKWVKEGNSLGRNEISMTLSNLRKRMFYGKALQFLEWLEASKRLDFVEQDYASRLDLVAKVHGLHKAEKYVNMIPESFRGEIIYRTLLANYASMGSVKKSEEVLNKIRDHGLPVTTFTCDQLLLLYKRVDWEKIVDVLMMMEEENIQPSPFTYRLLIDAKGRTNDITGMKQIVVKMKAEGVELDLQPKL
ncbi:putative Pentatricopeptide repeat-containing protein, mitochondrial [Cocos nucifera]|uniref:Putative Pentatricopeptide repeat-containing protein, mitochondrial n=1 Tax=Cocos nucifera TaxID=13894 RepID=A0A8K0IT44_COCNU|nr:putative Pentatricopeptide repeat-containing protein, mitochondrial [Cocos nucifera]